MSWDVTADPDRFDEALAWFESRFPVTEELLTDLGGYAGARAWTVAGVAQLDIVLELFVTIAAAIETGQSLSDWKKAAKPLLKKAWGDVSSHRLETIFRTNVQTAYNRGRYVQMKRVSSTRPYWMFDAILDSRTTPTCTARDRVLLPQDHPWWSTNYPPLHHQCFPAGTLVSGPRGARRIEGLRVGDPVYTHRGQGRVTELFRGSEALIELSFASGRTLSVTAGHPALTQRGWVPALELRPGDCLVHAAEVTVERSGVGNSEWDKSGLHEFASTGDSETLGALGDFDAESLLRQHKVDEDHVVAQHERAVECVGKTPAVEPQHEGTLRASGGHARLRVRAGILQQLLSARLNRSLVGGRRSEAPTRDDLGGDPRKTRVSLLGVASSPVLATSSSRAGSVTEPDCLRGATLGVAGPLVGNCDRAPAHGYAVFREELTASGDVREAEFATDLANREPTDLVEVAQDFGQALAVLLEQPELDCGLEVVAGHQAVDAPQADVFNIAVAPDESYIANGFVVHNCRSSVRCFTDEQAQKRGIDAAPPLDADEPSKGFGSTPDADEWRPDPNKYPDDLWEIYEQKQAASE